MKRSTLRKTRIIQCKITSMHAFLEASGFMFESEIKCSHSMIPFLLNLLMSQEKKEAESV